MFTRIKLLPLVSAWVERVVPQTVTGSSSRPDTMQVETVCSGDEWEFGFSQGRSLQSQVRQALSILTELEAFRLQKPKLLPLKVFRRIAEIKAGRFLSKALAANLPAMQTRLQGLAAGAGVHARSVYLLNAMEAVLSDVSHTSVVPISAACSAVAVTGRSSRSGHPIVAHNFDYLPPVRPLYTVRESRPAGKLRSLEFTAAPLGGAVDGINEAGLCVTYNYAYVTDRNHAGPTISMLVSEALSRCRIVPDAVEFLSKSKRWGGGLLMLGDATGRIEALELSNTRSSPRQASTDREFLFHTNRFASPGMNGVEIDDAAVFTEESPKALRNRRVHQSSDCRDNRFRERLAATTQLDADGILELMSDHGADSQPSADTICMHSDYWHTTACLQFFPRERSMRVAYDTACQARFATFAL